MTNIKTCALVVGRNFPTIFFLFFFYTKAEKIETKIKKIKKTSRYVTKWGLAYHLSTAACSPFLCVKSPLSCNEVKKNTLKWQIDDRTDRAFVSRLAESNQARIRRPRVIDRSDRMVPSSRFFSSSVTSRSFYYGILFPFVIGILPVIHWPEICKVQGRTDGSWTDKR